MAWPRPTACMTREFLQSQLEVGTSKCASVREAAAEIRELREHLVVDRRRLRVRDHRRLDPPVRRLDDPALHTPGALRQTGPGPRRRRPPDADLRHARPRRDRRRRTPRRPDGAGHVLPSPHPGTVDVVAVLARLPDRAALLPAVDLRRHAPHRAPRGVRLVGRVRTTCRGARARRPDRGLEQDLVGLRPSGRFPTLEMRIADVCTTAAHGASVAAVFQSVLAMLWQLKRDNQRWRTYSTMLIEENRWRAQRYGIDEGLIDFGLGQVVPCSRAGRGAARDARPRRRRLNCLDELYGIRSIMTRGTSAHRQIAMLREALAGGRRARGGRAQRRRLPHRGDRQLLSPSVPDAGEVRRPPRPA